MRQGRTFNFDAFDPMLDKVVKASIQSDITSGSKVLKDDIVNMITRIGKAKPCGKADSSAKGNTDFVGK